jgi:hypothetical protein
MPSSASRPAVVEVLAAFGGAMRSRGFRWYVFGAQAVVAYGRPRMTADVDVTVDLAGESPLELVRILTHSGFEQRIGLEDEFVLSRRLLPLAHSATGVPVDVIISQPGLQEDFLARSRLVDDGGIEVPLICAEDLVAMKILAGRRKDLEDVRGVLFERWESIDLTAVEDVLSLFEGPRDEGKLRRRLKRLVKQVRGLLGG